MRIRRMTELGGVTPPEHDWLMEPRTIWAAGETWRHLTAEVVVAGGATIVSEKGTSRLVDTTRREQMRLPQPGGRRLFGDSMWLPYDVLEVTPCGVVIEHEQWWARGYRIALVLAGCHEDWADTVAGRATVEAFEAGRRATICGHPPDACGAHYCVIATTASKASPG